MLRLAAIPHQHHMQRRKPRKQETRHNRDQLDRQRVDKRFLTISFLGMIKDIAIHSEKTPLRVKFPLWILRLYDHR